ncbi:MAG TPA: type II toxin-antitoxin system VapC family toxin [Candidatus Acidoferrum sp.]|nr:type II toxin-antitoxin system VapC family toxin [Candidatus Acidoferrum sp.]
MIGNEPGDAGHLSLLGVYARPPGVKRALQQSEEIWVSPVVLGELLAGFVRSKRRGKNERELRTFLASPRVNVVAVDSETAERYALILTALWRAGTPIPTNGLWIAATAMQYGLRILTSDAHYRKVTQVVVDYIEVH